MKNAIICENSSNPRITQGGTGTLSARFQAPAWKPEITTHEYRFKIDAYTPATMPTSRLAEYMRDLATLLGEREYVHFVRLDPGSTMLVQRVDEESAPKVRKRILDLRKGEGLEDASHAFKTLNRRLINDNAAGYLYPNDGAEILYFPGCNQPESLTFWAFTQPGSLDGLLIRIGDKDETVPVHLEEEGRSL